MTRYVEWDQPQVTLFTGLYEGAPTRPVRGRVIEETSEYLRVSDEEGESRRLYGKVRDSVREVEGWRRV